MGGRRPERLPGDVAPGARRDRPGAVVALLRPGPRPAREGVAAPRRREDLLGMLGDGVVEGAGGGLALPGVVQGERVDASLPGGREARVRPGLLREEREHGRGGDARPVGDAHAPERGVLAGLERGAHAAPGAVSVARLVPVELLRPRHAPLPGARPAREGVPVVLEGHARQLVALGLRCRAELAGVGVRGAREARLEVHGQDRVADPPVEVG